jgi:hypothetical protein
MRKFAFFLSVMLSLKVNANLCNADQIDLISEMFKTSPQAKHYEETSHRLLQLRYDQETLLKRPELSFGYEVDKSEGKNNKLSAELLFDVNEYFKHQTLKKLKKSELEVGKLEVKQEQIERAESAIKSLFQIAQNEFFLDKIESLLNTLKSSESIYANRPIRSREDQIIINSLSLLKNNLFLKKNRLISERIREQQNLKRLEFDNCSIDYLKFIQMIDKLNIEFTQKDISRTVVTLKHQLEASNFSSDLEKRRLFNNLKVGPSLSREGNIAETQYRIGVLVSFDVPTFENSNHAFVEQSKKLAEIKSSRALKDASSDVESLIVSFNEYTKTLKQLPTLESLESNLNSAKKSFGSGVISPLVYIEAYRSYVDFLEVSEEMRKNIFESYLKLRGMYENNPS